MTSNWRVIHGDVLRFCEHYKGEPFHALLCDPPYELGFMNQKFDKTGISFRSETWAALGKHLLPGAFGMAFASSRGWHRLAVAIEDAGFRIHPSIFGFCFGSGFPKATRIDTQVDAAAGAKQKVIGPRIRLGDKKSYPTKGRDANKRSAYVISTIGGDTTQAGNITAPATLVAEAWQGHRYGLQAMKPALEPLIVFQKPYDDCPVDSIVEHGAGALNIDAGRIRLNGIEYHTTEAKSGLGKSVYNEYANESLPLSDLPRYNKYGRWPPNFYVQHLPPHLYCPTCAVPYMGGNYCAECGSELEWHEGCRAVGMKQVKPLEGHRPNPVGQQADGHIRFNKKPPGYQKTSYTSPDGTEPVTAYDCPPWCSVYRLGEQSGERPVSGSAKTDKAATATPGFGYGTNTPKGQGMLHNDAGTAARFYLNPDWSYEIAERLDGADPVLYCPKSSRKERDAGLEGMPAKSIQTGCAGDFPTDDEGQDRDRFETIARNIHSTVKPISLGIWLCNLLAPPPEYTPRRLLVPFAGSGSEMISAILSGQWEIIVGIEIISEYVEIARARCSWWSDRARWGCDDPAVILSNADDEDSGQLPLFMEIGS